MSYEITVLGSTCRILASENPDFTKAVELFRLFDDSRINTIEAHMAIRMVDPNFKITVRVGSQTKCIVNAIIFACMCLNTRLLDTLTYDSISGTWNLNPDEEFAFGECVRTIFEYICEHFSPEKTDMRELLDLFLIVGGYDISRISHDNSGRFDDSLTYIKNRRLQV